MTSPERGDLIKERPMDPYEMMRETRDALAVKRVFGEPYQCDGVTVIPAASLRGGAGGGSGEGGPPGDPRSGSGSGGGFGLIAKPAGMYVIEGGNVRWQPAVDVNRIIVGGQIVALALLLVVRAFFRRR